jgi:two-component system, LytTR family, response regulator
VNALIVDDERLARSELRRLLAAHADVTIAGEAANAVEAEARLRATDVDVLFLDVQMPGKSGFELLERLETLPLVIFTTAYDEYAVRAFEVNAFDYLLKPIRPERLAVAIEKARAAWSASRAGAASAAKRSWSDRVFLRDGDRCWIVALADIELFEADGNYARAFFKAERPMVRTSLQTLEARLDPAVFFRASRRHIINLRHVEAIDDGVDDSYTVRLRSGRTVSISRRQSRRLRETLSL